MTHVELMYFLNHDMRASFCRVWDLYQLHMLQKDDSTLIMIEAALTKLDSQIRMLITHCEQQT